MPRPALTDEQRQATRRKIRDAAAKLHAENGLSNISARAIAEIAGVSVGTLYLHFDNLAELMQSLWRQPAERLLVEMQTIAKAHAAPQLRLRELLGAYVKFSEDNKRVFRGAFLFVRPEASDPPPQTSLDDDQLFSLFREVIIDGQSQGLFRIDDVDILAQTVVGAVHGAIAMPINMHRLALNASPQMPHFMIDAMLEWLQKD